MSRLTEGGQSKPVHITGTDSDVIINISTGSNLDVNLNDSNGNPITSTNSAIHTLVKDSNNAEVIGTTLDSAVITDSAGSITGFLRGLVKWAYERMPVSLGQKVKANSFPVTLASDDSIPITVNDNLTVAFGDSPSLDAFGRLRISNPFTIFDSKQLYDNLPLFWDDSQVSGVGTTSIHVPNEAASILSVSATTAGKRIRQTFRRFNYQPGKSLEVLITFSRFFSLSGNTKEVGLFDDNNGVFARNKDGIASIIIRDNVTGIPIDTTITQANWNLDTLDGNGPSGITADFTKTEIFVIDLEWLGVGRVRTGFNIDGLLIYTHEFNNANNLAKVYMSTPNLPLRYSIENDGTGLADDFDTICSTVISEGGQQQLGTLRYSSVGSTFVNANASGTLYAIKGIRLKSTHLSATVQITTMSLLSSTADNYEWLLMWNPTVAGTFTYTDESNSAAQTAEGALANTVTLGTQIAGGYGDANTDLNLEINTVLALGSTIAGTRDTMVLCVRPLSSNLDIYGGINWRELS